MEGARHNYVDQQHLKNEHTVDPARLREASIPGHSPCGSFLSQRTSAPSLNPPATPRPSSHKKRRSKTYGARRSAVAGRRFCCISLGTLCFV